MSTKTRRVPTEDEIAQLRELRAAKRQKLAEAGPPAVVSKPSEKGNIVDRDWVQLKKHPGTGVRSMTWNLLAQCLIRRELFPTSGCLKASQREGMMFKEMFAHKPDIMTMQEVDRLEEVIPALEAAGYSQSFAAGPGKKHGCMVAFHAKKYELDSQKMIQYDQQEVRSDGSEQARLGLSFKTRNIASLVALKGIGSHQSVIVATSHLFWHPRYNYERTRQAGILVREVLKFREELGHTDWPCIISGDFNFAPDDAAYALLTGNPLLPSHKSILSSSRVVHMSIDPSVPKTVQAKPAADDEEGGDDDEKRITSARPAIPSDGLLNDGELVALFKLSGAPLRSAYDEGQKIRRTTNPELPTFGTRLNLDPEMKGYSEPEWTSYTHYWKTVLDYIFIIDPVNRPAEVTGFLTPHKTESLVLGLPQTNVCGSDHVSLVAELQWP